MDTSNRSQDARRGKRPAGYGRAAAVATLIIVGLIGMMWLGRTRSAPNEPTASDESRAAERISARQGDLQGFNLLVITMDTTRADKLGCYGYDDIETPTIDGLASRGIRCVNAITPTPSTLPAHSSLMTGLYPHHHGARANGTFRLDDQVTTLAELLAARGYRTAATISAFVLDSRFGLDQGFDHYDDDLTKGMKFSPHMFRERAAELTNESATAWLRENGDARFFMWVHYFDPHAVYLPPEPFRSRYRDRLYEGEIAYTDAQIGLLLSVLDELGVRDRTLVVLTADHGEGLGEHGERTHSLLVHDATLHVPLIFHAPSKLPGPIVIRRQTCLVDVMPTVLSLLGMPIPPDLDGRNLCEAPSADPRPVYIETLATMTLHGWAPLVGVRRDDYKFVFAPRPELYDLRSDPRELVNLYDDEPGIADALKLRLQAMLGGDPLLASRGITPNLGMDEETRRRLASLGYITTVSPSADASAPPLLDPKDMVVQWEKVQQAINLQSQGRITEALPILEQCVAEVEGDIFARQVLVHCYQLRGEYEKVLQFAERSVELQPNDERLRLSLAAAHLALGHIEECETRIDEALAIEPEFAQAYVMRGRLAWRRGDDEQAMQHLQHAIDIDPGSTGPQAYCEIGSMHLMAGRLDQARAAYRQAIDIDALNGAARDGLANVLIEEKRYDEAEQQLAVGLRFDPNQPRAIATLAWLKLEHGDLDAAHTLCRRAFELNPNLPQAHNVDGLAYRRQDRFDLAEASYRKAIRHGPYLDAPHVNLAQLYVKQGRMDDAMHQFERALRANRHCKIALANLGARHFNDGRPDLAFDYYQRALSVDPDYALVHKNIVSIYAVRDQPAEAARHLRRYLDLRPDDPDAEALRAALTRAEREAASRERSQPDGSAPPIVPDPP